MASPANPAIRQYLIVMAGALQCALPLDQAKEAFRPWRVQAVKSNVRGMLGAAVVRGQVVPVLDLMTILGLDAETVTRYRLVRVRLRDGREAALQVTRVIGTRAMEAGALDEDISIILDATKLVDTQVWLDIAALVPLVDGRS